MSLPYVAAVRHLMARARTCGTARARVAYRPSPGDPALHRSIFAWSQPRDHPRYGRLLARRATYQWLASEGPESYYINMRVGWTHGRQWFCHTLVWRPGEVAEG